MADNPIAIATAPTVSEFLAVAARNREVKNLMYILLFLLCSPKGRTLNSRG
jgi:hypothetical protein